jgi:glutamine amidotransferase
MAAGLTAVVDYGLCNIDSIARVLEELGATVEKTRDPHVIERADRIVLPGVGSFGAAMRNLEELRLAPAIKERVAASAPFLGICLGMQLMAQRSAEHGDHEGLNLVDGSVVKLEPSSPDERIPHIGWNEVVSQDGAELFEGAPQGSDYYFVHSYHLKVEDQSCVIARTPYCGEFVSAVRIPGKPVFGTQFHPEKSQRAGHRLLKNFLAI